MTPETTTKFDPTPVTKSVINLDDFSKVTVGKKIVDSWSGISSVAEALVTLGNNTENLLKAIRDGIRTQVRSAAYENAEGFTLVKDGEVTADVFSGSMGHPKAVNALVLPLAKMSVDWSTATKEEKKAARADAVETIKSNPKLLQNLKNRSAEMFAAGESEEATEEEGAAE